MSRQTNVQKNWIFLCDFYVLRLYVIVINGLLKFMHDNICSLKGTSYATLNKNLCMINRPSTKTSPLLDNRNWQQVHGNLIAFNKFNVSVECFLVHRNGKWKINGLVLNDVQA